MGISREKKQLLVYLPASTRSKLKVRAARTGTSMSELVAQALSKQEIVLSEDVIRRAVKKMVRAAQKPIKVILFGSYARGQATPRSDVDLVIVEDGLDTWRMRLDEEKRLREALKLPVPVDLVLTDSVEWDKWKDEFGSVFYDAAHEGRVLHV